MDKILLILNWKIFLYDRHPSVVSLFSMFRPRKKWDERSSPTLKKHTMGKVDLRLRNASLALTHVSDLHSCD